MRAWERLRAVFRREQLDLELDEEMRTHIDLATEDFIQRGYSIGEARRLARVKFGSMAASKDLHRDSRGIAWLEGLAYDLRTSFRSLARDRAFAITAVLMLALALGLNVTAFSVMDTMLFRGLPLARNSDRLLFIQERETLKSCCLLYPDFLAWKEQAKSFEELAFVAGEPISLGESDVRTRDTTATTITVNTFRLLGVKPLLGRDFLPGDELPGASPVVILNYEMWQQDFGGTFDIIGKTIRVNKLPATIVGVTPEGFDYSTQYGVWMPFRPTAEMLQRKPGGYLAIGLLAEGATQERARAELDTINRRLESEFPQSNKGVRAVARNYSEFNIGPDAKMIYGSVWVAAWLVLMVACANIANLTIARTLGRSREFSTRLALGASHGRMVRQIFMESLLLALTGGTIAWFLAGWAIHTWAIATSTRYVVLDYSVDSTRWQYLILSALVSTLLFGLIPAVSSIRIAANGVFAGDARGATVSLEAKRISGALVAGQMALALILVMGGGVLARSLWNIVGAETGITGAGRILIGHVSVPRDGFASGEIRKSFWNKLRANITSVPGVESASMSSTIPTGNPGSLPFALDGLEQNNAERPRVTVVTAGAGYLRTLGASVLAGREFDAGDERDARPVALVNQSFVNQYWPGIDPLDRQVGLYRGDTIAWYGIVGVASNIMQDRPLRDEFVPVVYVPSLRNPPSGAAIFVRTRTPARQVAKQVRDAIVSTDPSILLEDYSTLQASLAFNRDRMDLEHAELGKYSSVAIVFAGISLLLASIGLYAVVAHSVSRRTKEIGVRMALGAGIGDVLRLVFREGMRPVGIGLVLGTLFSLGINRVLASQLVRISPYDSVTFSAGPLLLILVALIACQLPARRAIRVDPASALRHDS